MFVVFSPFFVAETKIILRYDFVAPIRLKIDFKITIKNLSYTRSKLWMRKHTITLMIFLQID